MPKKGKLSEADKALKREEQEMLRAIEAVLAVCNKEEDIFTRFSAFKKCAKKQHNLELHLSYFKRAQDMGKEVLAWAFDLTKKNMEAIYNATQDMKWNDKIKKNELADASARYILLTRTPVQSESKDDAKSKPKISAAQCVGFVHIRFENEGGPTLYICEFQLEKSVQRMGVGKFLMSLLELLAWKSDLDKVMLTAQQTNKDALAFYQKMGYKLDDADPNSGSYTLLSKARPATLAKSVPLPTVSRPPQPEDEEDDDFQLEGEEEGDFDEGDEGDEGDEQPGNVGNMIREIMKQEGPIVNVVLLEPDGTVTQQEVDMTPKKDTPTILLGGSGTFLGQYEEDEEAKAGTGSAVTVMVRKDTKGLPQNKTKLPAPLHQEKAHGRILLVRVDGAAIPQNFTVADYENLKTVQAARQEKEIAAQPASGKLKKKGKEAEAVPEGKSEQPQADVPKKKGKEGVPETARKASEKAAAEAVVEATAAKAEPVAEKSAESSSKKGNRKGSEKASEAAPAAEAAAEKAPEAKEQGKKGKGGKGGDDKRKASEKAPEKAAEKAPEAAPEAVAVVAAAVPEAVVAAAAAPAEAKEQGKKGKGGKGGDDKRKASEKAPEKAAEPAADKTEEPKAGTKLGKGCATPATAGKDRKPSEKAPEAAAATEAAAVPEAKEQGKKGKGGKGDDKRKASEKAPEKAAAAEPAADKTEAPAESKAERTKLGKGCATPATEEAAAAKERKPSEKAPAETAAPAAAAAAAVPEAKEQGKKGKAKAGEMPAKKEAPSPAKDRKPSQKADNEPSVEKGKSSETPAKSRKASEKAPQEAQPQAAQEASAPQDSKQESTEAKPKKKKIVLRPIKKPDSQPTTPTNASDGAPAKKKIIKKVVVKRLSDTTQTETAE